MESSQSTIDTEKAEPLQFVARFHDVKFLSGGGGRLTLDFSNDATKAIQEIQKLDAIGSKELNLMVVAYIVNPRFPGDHE